MCQETAPVDGSFSPQQEAAAGGKQPPVQETQQFSQMPHNFVKDDLHRDCAGDHEDRSSTDGEVRREAQPQALSASTLQLPPRQMARKGVKQCGELENILEESLSQEDNKHDSGSLKRSASTVSHDSIRSSGYFSNPRYSELRISQVSISDSTAENGPEESDGTLLGSIKQACGDGTEDEGVVMKLDHTNEFLESCESTGAELSSSNAPWSPSHSQAPCKNEEMAASTNEDDQLLEPVSRPRLFQITHSPSHKKGQLKSSDDDLVPEHYVTRRRSHSLPTTSRIEHLCSAALQLPSPSSSLQYPPSHSSSMSLDSDTTSEQSSMTGSQLSITSTISGKWCDLVCTVQSLIWRWWTCYEK